MRIFVIGALVVQALSLSVLQGCASPAGDAPQAAAAEKDEGEYHTGSRIPRRAKPTQGITVNDNSAQTAQQGSATPAR